MEATLSKIPLACTSDAILQRRCSSWATRSGWRSVASSDPETAMKQSEGESVSEATIYTWKSKYGGMDVSDAQKLKGLEDENRRLKHLVADLSLDQEVLKAVIVDFVSE